ncbi:DNA repair protein radc [Burkholderiales bacterium GJ-E10]|nr:DNA repair protein radc [Burkholderiales bacterium GJ-E10]
MRSTQTQRTGNSAKRNVKGAPHPEAVLQDDFFGSPTTTERMREDAVIEQAKRIIARRLNGSRVEMNSPKDVRDYFTLRMQREHEVFAVLFLDAQHRLIACDEIFRGTLNAANVYPREVVKQALHHNAAAVILAHNHPSGVAEPSRADESITQALQRALALIDVRVLDHIVVAGAQTTSFSDRGLL